MAVSRGPAGIGSCPAHLSGTWGCYSAAHYTRNGQDNLVGESSTDPITSPLYVAKTFGYDALEQPINATNVQNMVVAGLRYTIGHTVVFTLTVAKDHALFVGAAKVLIHNTYGCESFTNQLPNRLAGELALARKLGVTPLKVGEQAFDRAINEGTVKWVVTEHGELLFEPKFIDGQEIVHTALTNGKPVLAAGEAEIAGAKGHYTLLDITNSSGHYRPTDASLEIGRQAFEAAGIH